MKIWIDAQLSPAIARWLVERYGVDASALREVGLRDAEDVAIFAAARTANAVVMTKDADFAHLVLRLGAPPQIIWIRAGNSSTARLEEVLGSQWSSIVKLIIAGEALIEIIERPT